MKWVKEKLAPSFEQKYPLKKVLVADNAPCHHQCDIESLASLNKAKLTELMAKHDVEYVEYIGLPMTSQVRKDSSEIESEGSDVQDRGDCV